MIGPHTIQVEDRAGTREEEQRLRRRPAAAQVDHQGLLCRPVQSLFQHVDHQAGLIFRFQCCEQRNESRRLRSSFIDDCGQAVVHSRFQGEVGIEARPRGRSVVCQPIQTHEGPIGESRGQAFCQLRLAAAERTNDVIERSHVAQFEGFTAPRPGKFERDSDIARRLEQANEVPGLRDFAAAEIRAQTADFADRIAKLANAIFQCFLVCRQCTIESPRIACKDPRDFAKAEAERAQFHDVGGASDFGRAVGSPPRRGAARGNQAAMLVEPQRLGGNTELTGSFGWAEKSGGRVHESPRCYPDRCCYGGGRKVRVKRCFAIYRP
jgi:hypothetical protein